MATIARQSLTKDGGLGRGQCGGKLLIGVLPVVLASYGRPAALPRSQAEIGGTVIPADTRSFATFNGATWVRGGPDGPLATPDAGGQHWQLKIAASVNARWFGAVGDDVTDDTAAENAAALLT